MNDLMQKPFKLMSNKISNTSTNYLKTDDISNVRQNIHRAGRKNTPTLSTNVNEHQDAWINTLIKTTNFYL